MTVARELSEDDPADGPRVTGQLDKIWTKYTGNEPPYGLRDPSIDERRVLFELPRRPGRHVRAALTPGPQVMAAGGRGRRVARRAHRGAGAAPTPAATWPSSSGPRRRCRAAGRGHRGARRDRALVRRALGRRPRRAVQQHPVHPLPRRRTARVVHEREHRYRFSAWNTIYRALLAGSPPERYLLGQEVVGFAPDGDGRGARDALGRARPGRPGGVRRRDRRTARADLLPEVTPAYAGYVAWRGTLPEAALTPATRDPLARRDHLPGAARQPHPRLPHPRRRTGRWRRQRLVNFVWYRNVAPGAAFDDADDRPRRPGPARCRCRPARSRAASCAACGPRRRSGSPPSGRRGRHGRGRGAVRAGGVRHRGAPHGASAGSASRRRRVRGAAPRRGGHGQGRRRRLGAGRAIAAQRRRPGGGAAALGAPQLALGRALLQRTRRNRRRSQSAGDVGVPATRRSCSASTDRAADPAVAGGRARLW